MKHQEWKMKQCTLTIILLLLGGCSPNLTPLPAMTAAASPTSPFTEEPPAYLTTTATVSDLASPEPPAHATVPPLPDNVADAASSVQEFVRAYEVGLVHPDALSPDDLLYFRSAASDLQSAASQTMCAWSEADYDRASLLADSILRRVPPLPSILDGDRLEHLYVRCDACTTVHANGNALVRVRDGTWISATLLSNSRNFTITARFMPLSSTTIGQGTLAFDVGATLSVGAAVISPPGIPADPSRYRAIALNDTPFDHWTALCDFALPQANQWTEMTLRMSGPAIEVSYDTGTVCRAEAFLLDPDATITVRARNALVDFIQIVWLPRTP